MTICVRYTHNMEIHERFLGFVDCSEKADAEAIHCHIKTFLDEHGLSKLPVVAQCYDGAAVMAGKVNGVQQRIRQDHPSAIYIHCMAHKLNLVLIEACKVNQTATGFFAIMEALYKFFGQPGTHHAFLQMQKQLGIKADLSALSDTRWACRWHNVSAVKHAYNSITATLEEFSVPPYRRFTEASGLLHSVEKLEFCVCLIVFSHALRIIHIASQALQKADTTLAQASSVLQTTIRGLQDMRSKWEAMWGEIITFCESHNISVTEPEHKRPARVPAASSSALSVGLLGQRDLCASNSESLKERWARRVFYPVIDALVGACNKRFSEEAMDIAQCVDAVLKCNADGALGLMKKYASTLSINIDLAHAEMTMVKMSTGGMSLANLKTAALTGFYPNFAKLLKLALSLPVGTATCERSFSAMRRVRNWMRTTMAQQRLSSLSLLYIESDITKKIKPEDIVDRFDAKAPRRMLLH